MEVWLRMTRGGVIKRALVFIAVALVTILAFQNCSKPSSPVSFSANTSFRPGSGDTEDNGYGYDGKVYVVRGNACPDGSLVQARILLRNESEGSLEREKCQDIAPVALTSADFQIDVADSKKLYFRNETFSEIGTKVDLSLVTLEGKNCYWMKFDFGIPADTMDRPEVSGMRLYEDGIPLGPAHSMHEDIRNIGLGRFSHWVNYLYFSASDNSNPLTNGRTYTWDSQ